MPVPFPSDFERWRGGVDEKLRSHEEAIKGVREIAIGNSARIGVLEVKVGRIAAQIGIAAALGSLVGGALVTVVVYFLTAATG